MKWSTKIRKWIRAIHRDLGYLLVGIAVIYGVSGFLLNHMDGKDPAFDSTEDTVVLNDQLHKDSLLETLNSENDFPPVKRILPDKAGIYRVLFDGGIGVYNSNNGHFSYEFHRKKPIVYFINKLHYNKVKGWTVMGDFFAFALIFFALSGLFMIKGKKGFKHRGIWLVLLGLAVPLCYVFLI